jgi:hypothetical protein
MHIYLFIGSIDLMRTSKEVNVMTEGSEFERTLLKLFEEIARREKDKSVEAGDYVSAFALAIVEGFTKEQGATKKFRAF